MGRWTDPIIYWHSPSLQVTDTKSDDDRHDERALSVRLVFDNASRGEIKNESHPSFVHELAEFIIALRLGLHPAC